MTTLARRLRAARKAADLSQQRLAERAQVSVSAISRIEQGQTRYPRAQEFDRIAAALGTTADALYAGVQATASEPVPTAHDEIDQRILRAFRGNLRQIADFMIQTDELDEHDRRLVLEAVEWAKNRIEAARAWEAQRSAAAAADRILHTRRADPPPATHRTATP